MNTICNDPYIYTMDDFLTSDECEFIINVSKGNMNRAGVSNNPITLQRKRFNPPTNEKYMGRTNSSYWISHDAYPETLEIAKRIAKKLDCDYTHFEKFQIIHYKENEEYQYHYDAYNITERAKYKMYCNERGNRLKTVLVYLNDVEEGGGTSFDSLREYKEGLTIEPKMGKMVVFSNLNVDGSLNKKSRHSGLPVTKGEKWAFNLWLREKPETK